MTETDDIVARLHNAERAQFQCGEYQWMPKHSVDARKLFVEAATAIAERDAQIERLEERCAAYKGQVETGAAEIERLTADHEHDVEDLCNVANTNLESMLKQHARATTAERERDEARAEVEQLRTRVGRYAILDEYDYPGEVPAFSEAIAAAVAVESGAIQRAGLIAGLREAAQIADQWSEARLDEANAPIISGDVLADAGVFVQSTADAHAGYRLMDLSKAIRARIAALEAGEEEK